MPSADGDQRYDRLAAGYGEWWGPVIAPAALTVLDQAHPLVDGRDARILDLGTGTGTLALDAARRWPQSRIVGVDPSAGMLSVARDRVARDRVARDRPARGMAARIEFVQAFADALPFPDASFDVVVSSFVLQLVPNRHRALREARRVLRPGGTIHFITWLSGRDEAPFEPDEVFHDVLYALDLDVPGDDPHADDIVSAEAAVRQVRRAGFRDVEASTGRLRHVYDAPGYVAFLERFDEEDLFSSLDDAVRDRLRADLLSRLRELPADDLVLRLPTVLVRGVRGVGGPPGS